jgi:hypothetical protein
LTLVVLRRRLADREGLGFGNTLSRSLAAGGLVALATWLIARGIGWSSPWTALAATVVGAVIGFAEYFAVAAALRMRELDDLWSLYAPRVRRGGRPSPSGAPAVSIGGPADREGRTV